MPTRDRHALTPSQLDAIFDTIIRPNLFDPPRHNDNPLVILVGAQPGAGKTRAGLDAIHESNRVVVPIVGDDLRPFHPLYQSLIESDPLSMPDATAQASGAWVERAIHYAADKKVNVLIEGTFRDPDTVLATASLFKSLSFSVEAHIVAVPPEVSRAAIAERFVHDEQTNGQARFTPLAAHDAALAGMPETIRRIAEAGSPVDRIVVRTRAAVVFDRTRTQGRSIRGVLRAIQTEWDRPLTREERQRFAAQTEMLTDYLDNWHAGDERTDVLVRQMRMDQHYVELASTGQVAVRGHVRDGHDVSPYVRGLPT